jgi:hypothetical protein
MSILYEYLKVLENKKGKRAVNLEPPARQKKNVAASPYFLVIFVILGLLLSLFFLKDIMNVNTPKETRGLADYQQSPKFTLVRPDTQGFNKGESPPAMGHSLKGIIYNAESPSAIIDGRLVEKNGKIGDWQVIEISPSEVKLENPRNNSSLTLKLNSSSEQ